MEQKNISTNKLDDIIDNLEDDKIIEMYQELLDRSYAAFKEQRNVCFKDTITDPGLIDYSVLAFKTIEDSDVAKDVNVKGARKILKTHANMIQEMNDLLKDPKSKGDHLVNIPKINLPLLKRKLFKLLRQ